MIEFILKNIYIKLYCFLFRKIKKIKVMEDENSIAYLYCINGEIYILLISKSYIYKYMTILKDKNKICSIIDYKINNNNAMSKHLRSIYAKVYSL